MANTMKQFFSFMPLLFSVCSFAQLNSLTPGATLLFQNVKSKLTSAEKNKIFNELGFLLSKDRKQFIADAEATDFPFDAHVYPTDINGDGKEEIFVSFGNTYTSGNTGQSIVVFVKDASGKYQRQLGFPGTVPDALPAATNKYPDLVIGGPGFEFPVWRWNGKEYALHRKIKEQELLKTKTTNIEEVSKAYTGTLKE
jgi:hypothetical protein